MVNRKSISKYIIILLGIRVVLNLVSPITLFTMMGYRVSFLSFWSIALILLLSWRHIYPPYYSTALKNVTIAFIVLIVLFGATRVYYNTALIIEVGYTIIFLLGIIVSPKILSDFSIYYIARIIFKFSILLIIIHSAFLFINPNAHFGLIYNYLGLFKSPGLASSTFLVISCYCWILIMNKNSRKMLHYIVLILALFYLIWTFRRVEILALGAGITAYLILNRKMRHVAFISILVMLLYLTLSSYFESFYIVKLSKEIEAYKAGDYLSLGSGRIENYIRGIEYFRDFSLKNKIVGKGSAWSHKLAEDTWGTRMYAHGQFVATLVDYGIIGLSLLIIMFIIFIYYSFRLSLYYPEGIGGISLAVSVACITISMVGILLASGSTMVLLTPILSFPNFMFKYRRNFILLHKSV